MEKEKAGGCFLASGMEARTRVRVWGGKIWYMGKWQGKQHSTLVRRGLEAWWRSASSGLDAESIG